MLALVSTLFLAGPPPAAAAEHGKAAKAEGGVPDGPVYVKVPPIVLPVYKGGKVTRQAGIVVMLELAKGKTEADIEPNRRQLFDAFLTDLYALYELRGNADRVIEPTMIKQTLQDAGDRILGAGTIEQVLIQQAFERVRAR